MAEMFVKIAAEKIKAEIFPGETVFTVLQRKGLELHSSCGGAKTCGKCKVGAPQAKQPLTREEKALLLPEEVEKGVRLACCLQAVAGLEVEVTPLEKMVVLTTAGAVEVKLDPLVKRRLVTLPEPTLADQRDLARRLLAQESLSKIAPPCLPVLGSLAPQAEVAVTIVEDSLVDLEPNGSVQSYGVAFDLGTTTLAAYLVDLLRGEELAVRSMANPQRKYGADVISRINYGETEKQGVFNLQESLRQGLNYLLRELCQEVSGSAGDVRLVTIAGNTVLLHTLLGVRALGIANAPFAPVFLDQIRLKPEELGLKIACQGLVVLLPGVSGYVGADIIADLLVCNFPKDSHWHGLLIDIGTNGEIVLGNGVEAVACSTAAGPALEGASIKEGMPGVPGALSFFTFEDQKAVYKVIGGGPAQGICGSGLIGIVAELLRYGFVDSSGAFVPPSELAPWQRALLTTTDRLPSFIVVSPEQSATGRPLVLTQKDVREVQLAKGAIRAGILTLLEETHLTFQEIDEVFIAGGFGNFVNIEQACLVGLIPKELKDRVTRIGNGAGLGAKLALLNQDQLALAAALRETVRYVELSAHPRFQSLFMEALFF